jgi:hypothetical protein
MTLYKMCYFSVLVKVFTTSYNYQIVSNYTKNHFIQTNLLYFKSHTEIEYHFKNKSGYDFNYIKICAFIYSIIHLLKNLKVNMILRKVFILFFYKLLLSIDLTSTQFLREYFHSIFLSY